MAQTPALTLRLKYDSVDANEFLGQETHAPAVPQLCLHGSQPLQQCAISPLRACIVTPWRRQLLLLQAVRPRAPLLLLLLRRRRRPGLRLQGLRCAPSCAVQVWRWLIPFLQGVCADLLAVLAC